MKKSENKQIARIKDYKIAFGTRAGQAVLYDLMRTHHVLSPCFVPKSRAETVLREGERNAVLRIMGLLKMDPIKLQEMIEKNQEDNYE